MTDDQIFGICSGMAFSVVGVSFFVYLAIQSWKTPPSLPTSSDTLTDRLRAIYPHSSITTINFTGSAEEFTKFCKDNGLDPKSFVTKPHNSDKPS